MNTIQTKHFFVGFEHPRTRSNHGQVFLNGETFANVWQNPQDHPHAGKWTLNRDMLAINMELTCNYPPTTTLEEMLQNLEEWLMAEHPTLKPHDSIGDLMALEDWLQSVENRLLIDYDGFGIWATATHEGANNGDYDVSPSDIRQGVKPPKWATHVKWYNK